MSKLKKCKNCLKRFEPKGIHHKFCCGRCRREFTLVRRRENYGKEYARKKP